MHIPDTVSSLTFLCVTGKRHKYRVYRPIIVISLAAAIPCSRHTCAKTFLHMRQNLLDSLHPAVGLPPGATVPVQAVQQCPQRKQIRDAERRPTCRHPHKRILGSKAGPGLPYGTQRPVICGVIDPPHPRHRDGLDRFELSSEKRMKRVRYTKCAPLNAA